MRRRVLSVMVFVLFSAVPAFAQSSAPDPEHKAMSKWWAAAVAAGPIFDGATTWWAMEQSGPAMRIREGNGFYHKIFGKDAKGWEIMAFKTGQALILGYGMHEIGKKKEGVERVIYAVVVNSLVSGIAGGINIKRGMRARRINAEYAVSW